MINALIISATEKSHDYFKQILSQNNINRVSFVKNAGEARRLLIDNDFDLCIINTPLPDEFGEKLANNIATTSYSQVMIIVKVDIFDEVSHKVEDFGVLAIAKPINKTLFWNSLKLLSATLKKIRMIETKNKKLLQTIDDIKVIDRAKCALIAELSMTEPEAHRHIEKCAMDKRLSRREVAEEILKDYM